MATIFTETFEGGSTGATIAVGNSGFDYISGSPIFAAGLHGALAMKSTASTAASHYGQASFASQASIYTRFYVKLNAPGVVFYLSQVLDTAVNAILSVQSTGALRMRNGAAATVGPALSDVTLSDTDWTRVEWHISTSTQQLQMFAGANVEGATPSWDSGPITWSGPAMTRAHIGSVASVAGADVLIDEYGISDTGWLGSAASPEPPVIEYPAFRYTGAEWQPCEIITI